MLEKTDKNWPRFVRTPEAARLLDLSPRTLEKHRCDGTGPQCRLMQALHDHDDGCML